MASHRAYEASVSLGASPANTIITQTPAEKHGEDLPPEYARFKRLTEQLVVTPKKRVKG
jgi:hypothetical protein